MVGARADRSQYVQQYTCLSQYYTIWWNQSVIVYCKCEIELLIDRMNAIICIWEQTFNNSSVTLKMESDFRIASTQKMNRREELHTIESWWLCYRINQCNNVLTEEEEDKNRSVTTNDKPEMIQREWMQF